MIDVSMAGASIVINAAGLKSEPITDFADDGTPIEIPNLEVAGGNMNLNGLLVTWTKPAPVNISFTLIPGSVSESRLRAFLASVHIGGKGDTVSNALISTLVLTYPTYFSNNGSTNRKNAKTVTFSNGRLLSGPPAVGSNNDGKASSTTWNFMFESFKAS